MWAIRPEQLLNGLLSIIQKLGWGNDRMVKNRRSEYITWDTRFEPLWLVLAMQSGHATLRCLLEELTIVPL